MSSSPPISIQAAPLAAQTPATATDAAAPDPQPWWKFGHVWLVIAGPAIVVVAGFITFAIAARAPDPVISPDYYRKGVEINQTLQEAEEAVMAPALKARNHAATPAADQPR